jgi:hypothetical protein
VSTHKEGKEPLMRSMNNSLPCPSTDAQLTNKPATTVEAFAAKHTGAKK